MLDWPACVAVGLSCKNSKPRCQCCLYLGLGYISKDPGPTRVQANVDSARILESTNCRIVGHVRGLEPLLLKRAGEDVSLKCETKADPETKLTFGTRTSSKEKENEKESSA